MLDDTNDAVLHTERMRGALERLAMGSAIETDIRAIATRALSDPAGLTAPEIDLLIEALMSGRPTGCDVTS